MLFNRGFDARDNAPGMVAASRIFSAIQLRFPTLLMHRDDGAPVELCYRMPEQTGLKHAVNLNLQNTDELHFSVGEFWCEWFPCTNPDVAQSYLDAVIGWLAGQLRVMEYYRGARCVCATLQRPENGEAWGTVRSSYHVSLNPVLYLFRRTTRVIQNV